MFMQIRIKRKIFINTKRQPIGANTGDISKTLKNSQKSNRYWNQFYKVI